MRRCLARAAAPPLVTDLHRPTPMQHMLVVVIINCLIHPLLDRIRPLTLFPHSFPIDDDLSPVSSIHSSRSTSPRLINDHPPSHVSASSTHVLAATAPLPYSSSSSTSHTHSSSLSIDQQKKHGGVRWIFFLSSSLPAEGKSNPRAEAASRQPPATTNDVSSSARHVVDTHVERPRAQQQPIDPSSQSHPHPPSNRSLSDSFDSTSTLHTSSSDSIETRASTPNSPRPRQSNHPPHNRTYISIGGKVRSNPSGMGSSNLE